jgi:3D (Asp-Asp-Asp) domain-containing protein
MARTRELKVIIAGDADKLDREIRRSNKGLDDLGKHTRLTASITSKGFHGMRAAATGLVAGLGGAVMAAKSFVDAASDINESLTKNQALFGRYSKGIERFSKTTASALGVSRREALAAAGTFGGLFDAINIGEKDSARMSKRLVTLAADLASFNNASPEEALDALRSGLAGEAEPMRRFNAFLSETRVQAEAMRMGIGKAAVDTDKLKAAQLSAEVAQQRYNVAVARYGASSAEAKSAQVSMMNAQDRATKATKGGNVTLTEAQKVQARYSLILKDTTKAHGDFARTSQGDANQTRILKAQYADMTAELGGKLLPAKLKVTRALNKFIGEMQNGTGQGGKFVDTLKNIWTEIKPVVMWVGRAVKNVAEFTAQHPALLRLAGGVLAVSAAVKGMRFVSAATGFSDLVKAGTAAAKGLKSVLRKGAQEAGETVAANVAESAANRMPTSLDARKGRFSGAAKGFGRGMGKLAGPAMVAGLVLGIAEAWPSLQKEWEKLTKDLPGPDWLWSPKAFKKLFSRGDGPGKMALPHGKAGNLMGARASLGPYAAIGKGYGLQVTSGRRPGSITSSGNVSYHSTGEAIDMSGGKAAMLDYAKLLKSKYGKRLAELIHTPMGLGIKNGRPFKYTGQVAADHFDHVHVAVDTGKPGVGDGLGKFRSTAYGPPWGGIQGTGVTASGVNLKGSPHIYGVAADPRILPLGTRVKINPNPFGYGGSFKVFDTGGAIKGRRIDFYDWRGRKTQMAWGSRTVNVSTVGSSGAGAGSSRGGASAEALQKQSDANQTRIDKLRTQLDRVPKGLAGAVQRDKIQAQIRSLQATQRNLRGDLRSAPTAAERRESEERSGSRLVNKLVAPFTKGFRLTSGRARTLGTEVEDLETTYGQAERAASLTDEDLGTPQGRKQRVSELAALAGLKRKTLDRQKKRAAALVKAINNRESMLRKLRSARGRAKGARRAKINERIRNYEESLDELKAELRSLGFAIRDTELDIADLAKEAKEAAATPDTTVEAAEPGPTVSERVSDLLSLVDLKERAGLMDAGTAAAQRQAIISAGIQGQFGATTEREQLQLMGDLREAQQAGVQAVEDNTNAIRELQKSIDDNTAFARGVIATENASLTKSLADIISGQIAGFGIAGRALMPGTSGVRARY